ncbi:MAG: ABC transporter permease [Spirochaetota bacterium]|nr:ABC transporter permease [Spirochaetota bacterium]
MIENILKQIYFTGVKALFVMSAVSLILGGIIIFVCAQLGLSETVISNVLIATIIQYVGPLVTMMIIIGRSGTAIASEIGNMKVSNEIEALEMMGIDSLHFVAAPRIIGMTISILCLGVYFGLVGILGGALVIVNVLETFSADKFYQTFFNSIELSFIIENIFKIFGFGIIISSVGCYQGFKVKISSTEIPQTTTQSVGRSIILCFIYYAFITIIFVL